jgi:hypothetical protein
LTLNPESETLNDNPYTLHLQPRQRNSIAEFEALLKTHHKQIMEDTFIRDYIEDLLKNIRTQVGA